MVRIYFIEIISVKQTKRYCLIELNVFEIKT